MNEKIFIVTDLCMWENNKQNKTNYPHAIQVVDAETGQVRYIRSGSKIAFIEGQITPSHSQEQYEKVPSKKVPSNFKKLLQRISGKRGGKAKDEQLPEDTTV